MKRKYNAKIRYTMNEDHPDKGCVENFSTLKEMLFEDTYWIDKDYFYDDDEVYDYISHDMKVVASGGYDTTHIDNVEIIIIDTLKNNKEIVIR